MPDPAAKTYARLLGRAYRLLAKREHSAWELRRKLLFVNSGAAAMRNDRKTKPEKPDPEQVDQLLKELAEQNAQSDVRFAEQHCRRRFSGGRGPVKLRYELTNHHINDTVVAQVMAPYESKWRALAAEVRTRKFPTPPTTYQDWAKQARFLQQRGFTTDQIGSFRGDGD